MAPGDRTEPRRGTALGWMPARLASVKGSASEGKVVAHPAPRTFSGPLMTALGRGDAPALAEAGFFAFVRLRADCRQCGPGPAGYGRSLARRAKPGPRAHSGARDGDRRGSGDVAGESRLRAARPRAGSFTWPEAAIRFWCGRASRWFFRWTLRRRPM